MEMAINQAVGSQVKNLISVNLKRLREDNGISQLVLAKKTGLTHNFINDIENNKKCASCATIEKLSKALDVEPFQLFMPIHFTGNEFEFATVIDFMRKMKKEMKKIMDYYKMEYNKIEEIE